MAIFMTPPVVMAVTSSVESRAINITVNNNGTVDDAANDDGPVINATSNYRAFIAISTIIAVAIAPSGFNRCSSESAEHKSCHHRKEMQFAGRVRSRRTLTTQRIRESG